MADSQHLAAINHSFLKWKHSCTNYARFSAQLHIDCSPARNSEILLWFHAVSRNRKTAERGYEGKWQRLSKQFLRQPENALRVMCESEGPTKQAEVVDHITPDKGDQGLFWDPANWQGSPAAP